MEFLAPLLAALRPVVTAEAARVLDQIAAKAAPGAEEDLRQAERDLLDWITRSRDCGHGDDLAAITERLDRIETAEEKTMTALDNLQQADSALKDEVTTAMADWAQALQNANSANDPAIQAVADDINAQVQSLTSADPANAQSAPSDGGTPAGQ